MLAQPRPLHGLNFAETFGEYGYLMRARAAPRLRRCLSPINAACLLLGMETLPLRMARHVANALAIADSCASSTRLTGWVCRVRRQSAARARARTCPRGRRSLPSTSRRTRGGRAFIEGLELWSHLANVGDAKSLVIHPASTTHQQLTDEELAASGVTPRWFGSRSGWRTWTTSSGISSADWARLATRPSWREPSSRTGARCRRSCGARARWRSSASRRASCARATSSATTCSGTATA